MTLLSGCDFLRSALGKPTSKDIEAARAARNAVVAPAPLEVAADTVADTASEPTPAGAVAKTAAPAGASGAAAKAAPAVATAPAASARYSVIVGSFKTPGNADKLAQRLAAEGEKQISKFTLSNGFTVISVLDTDSFRAAKNKLNAVSAAGFLPADCWILDNSK